MAYRRNYRKYNLGVQQVMVPEKGDLGDVSGKTLGMTYTGYKLGSALGPIGGIAGAAIGGLTGLTKGFIDKSIENRQHNEAISINKYIAENQRPEDPNLQMWQAENGMSIQSKKPVEVEKDELVFKRTSSGKYRLKADFKGGKTHEAGGEPYVAEKGDVIYPGKMREKVMKAYRSGNFPFMESIRMTLPKDSDIAKGGLDGVDDDNTPIVMTEPYYNFPNPAVTDDNYVGPGLHDNELGGGTLLDLRPDKVTTGTFDPKFPNTTSVVPRYKPKSVSVPSTLDNNSTGNIDLNFDPRGIIQASPTIYNSIKGTFGKVQQPTRRFINSTKYKYTDTSAPLIQASNEQQTIDMANANRTLGSRGQALSYMSQAGVSNYKRKSAIIADQINRKTAIHNSNVDLENTDKRINTQLANQYDNEYLQNKAKKTEYLGKSLEGASALSQNEELMNNMKERDKLLTSTLKTSNYGFEDSLGLTGYYAPDGSFVSGNRTFIKNGDNWLEKNKYNSQSVKIKYKYK